MHLPVLLLDGLSLRNQNYRPEELTKLEWVQEFREAQSDPDGPRWLKLTELVRLCTLAVQPQNQNQSGFLENLSNQNLSKVRDPHVDHAVRVLQRAYRVYYARRSVKRLRLRMLEGSDIPGKPPSAKRKADILRHHRIAERDALATDPFDKARRRLYQSDRIAPGFASRHSERYYIRELIASAITPMLNDGSFHNVPIQRVVTFVAFLLYCCKFRDAENIERRWDTKSVKPVPASALNVVFTGTGSTEVKQASEPAILVPEQRPAEMSKTKPLPTSNEDSGRSKQIGGARSTPTDKYSRTELHFVDSFRGFLRLIQPFRIPIATGDGNFLGDDLSTPRARIFTTSADGNANIDSDTMTDEVWMAKLLSRIGVSIQCKSEKMVKGVIIRPWSLSVSQFTTAFFKWSAFDIAIQSIIVVPAVICIHFGIAAHGTFARTTGIPSGAPAQVTLWNLSLVDFSRLYFPLQIFVVIFSVALGLLFTVHLADYFDLRPSSGLGPITLRNWRFFIGVWFTMILFGCICGLVMSLLWYLAAAVLDPTKNLLMGVSIIVIAGVVVSVLKSCFAFRKEIYERIESKLDELLMSKLYKGLTALSHR